MKNQIIITVSILIGIVANGQAPTVEWQQNYGGSSYDGIYDQQQTADGGYVLVGATNSPEMTGYHWNQDILVVKINNLGGLEWQKVIGGDSNESGSNIHQTVDGGYLLCGETSSDNGDFTNNKGMVDFFLMKLDSTGNILWQKNYGGSGAEFASKFIELSDGGYIIAGTTNSDDGDVTVNLGGYDLWLVKINALGTIEWQKSYGGLGDDILNDFIKTADGGYILTGETNSSLPNYHNGSDVLVVKTDGLGNLVWQKCYGGSNWDYGSSVIETSDGNVMIGASSQSTDGDLTLNRGGFFDLWMLKIDLMGGIIWEKTYGGSGGEQLTEIRQTTDGGYVATGLTTSTDGDITNNYGGSDFWIVKVSNNGTLVWQKSLGGPTNDYANCVLQTTDGGFLVTGANAFPNESPVDILTVKLSAETLAITQITGDKSTATVSPNPTTHSFTINGSKITNVSVFALDGKVVKEFAEQDKYDIGELADGIYLVKIISDFNEIQVLKIVKI